MSDAGRRIRLAIVNDYDIVVRGLAALLADHTDEIDLVEAQANVPVSQRVEIVLYDTFAQSEPDFGAITTMVDDPLIEHVVAYSWNFNGGFVRHALERGVSGFLSKELDGAEIVSALQRVVAGDRVISAPPGRSRRPAMQWPGREQGLNEREAEILALITQGRSNLEIADLLHLSINTIKGNIRTAYRKIGAANRVDAVIWGRDHGMTPDHGRLPDLISDNA